MSAMDISCQADAARAASRTLAVTRRELKDAALDAMADALLAHEAELLKANASDVAAAREAGTDEWLIDRLCLTSKRVALPRVLLFVLLRQSTASTEPSRS